MKQIRKNSKKRLGGYRCRAGAASIDYLLVVGFIVTVATFSTFAVPRIIRLVYEMTVTLVGSPLM